MDIDNKYIMAVPYNVYTNSRLSISSKKVLFKYLLEHKANKVWPYFYKLGNQDYSIGIIVMTKVEGMIGDELIDKEIYRIDNKLGPELSSISLSPSSPNRDIIDKPKTITLLTSILALTGGLLVGLGVPNGPFRKAQQQIKLVGLSTMFKHKPFKAAAPREK